MKLLFNTNNQKFPSKYEIFGPLFFSIIFYLMYTIMINCVYMDSKKVYVIMFIAHNIILFSLIIKIVSIYKYYSVYNMYIYKINSLILGLELTCLCSNSYIYTNNLHLDAKIKYKYALYIEIVLIIATILLYTKAYSNLKNITAKEECRLKKIYYIICDENEKKKYSEIMNFCNGEFLRFILIHTCIIFFINKIWYIAILYAIIFRIIAFKKGRKIFDVVYDGKYTGTIMNVIFNVITVIGFISSILLHNNLIEISILEKFGGISDMEIMILAYLPYVCLSLKLYGMNMRRKVED